MNKGEKNLFQAALLARAQAYAPYSNYAVGAAIETESGEIFSGCNVECANYKGGACAERVALYKAVSSGQLRIKKVCVVTDAKIPAPPCGFCRQELREFSQPKNLEILIADVTGIRSRHTLEELLPHSFGPENLG